LNGSGAKSYMRKGFLIYEEMRKYLVIYEEAITVIIHEFLNFLIYEENFLSFFIGVRSTLAAWQIFVIN
jgi:hypothetical protein